jgi:hypothetical protein
MFAKLRYFNQLHLDYSPKLNLLHISKRNNPNFSLMIYLAKFQDPITTRIINRRIS